MRLACLFTALYIGVASAQEPEALAPFDIETVIDASIADLDPPRWYPEVVSWKPAIITNSEEAEKRVKF